MRTIRVSENIKIEVGTEMIYKYADLGKLDKLAEQLTECMPSMFDKVYEELCVLALERWVEDACE